MRFVMKVRTKNSYKMKLSGKILIIGLMISFLSCAKQDRENTITSQEGAIDSYISSLENVEVVRNGGSNRVIVTPGNNNLVVERGDSLYIRYAGYRFSRGKGGIFATNDPVVAIESGFPCLRTPEKIKLGATELVEGLDFGLEGVKEGEYCYIIFSAKYGYGNVELYNIPKLTPLFYEVWVDKVIKK